MVEIVDLGHSYKLENLKTGGDTLLQFYKDPELHDGFGQVGPSTQEVIRACIDRVITLDSEKHWEGNREIVFHLRKALILFEVRALHRLVEEEEAVELIPINSRGHIWAEDNG